VLDALEQPLEDVQKDDDPDDENLNQSDGALKQGATRVDRGENFFKAVT